MLLAKLALQPDECLLSYLIRLSEKNGFKHVGHLLNYAGLSWKNNRAPTHQILSGEFDVSPLLSELGLVKCRSNIASTYQSFQRVIDTPYILVKTPRVCPDCLEELGYCKSQWALLPMVACPIHKKMLVDVNPATGQRLGWYRQYLNRFNGENHPIKASGVRPPDSAIQQSRYIEALLSRKQPSHTVPVILQGLRYREALSLIHFIAHYQTRMLNDSFHPLGMQNHELAQTYQQVWEALKSWPGSFYALLSQYVEQPMSSNGIGGLNKHFRDLYERLHRQHENKGVARIKVEFDRYIDQYWPGVLEPERITRIQLASPTRNKITKKEAARILGSRPEKVDKLVLQGRLTPVVFKGKAHFLRNQVEALANEISSNWSMAKACKALEITRYQLKQLLDAGIISALQKPNSLNRDWLIDKQACLALIDRLRSNARKPAPPPSVVSMAGVHRQGYSIVQLVLAMQSGELEYGVEAVIGAPASLKQFTAFKINEID